jgi:large subunit ribosomal protein L13
MSEQITIDATDRALGRVATEAVILLRGKNKPTFVRHLTPNVTVTIENASKMKVSERKQAETTRSRYSGYPGGLKKITWERLIAKKGFAEPLRLAILGMLPKNKLRAKLIKQVKISE